jgi:hypothetical protein
MQQTRRPCLQLGYRAPDPLPDELPVTVALIEHFLGAPRRGDLGVIAMFPDQQIGRSPYISIGNYKGPPFFAAVFTEPEQSGEFVTAGSRQRASLLDWWLRSIEHLVRCQIKL